MSEEIKTTDSIISEAMKEGIDFGPQSSEAPAKQDVKTESSPKTEAKEAEPTNTAKTGEPSVEEAFKESKLPAHLFPRFKEMSEANRKLKEELKNKDEQLKDPRIARLFAQKEEKAEQVETKAEQKKSVPTETTDEQKAALVELKKALGVDKYEEVIAQLQEERNKQREDAFNKELDSKESEIKKWSEDNGLDYSEEVQPWFGDWLTQNPEFKGLGKATYQAAWNAYKAENISELVERKKNLEMIKERDKKRSGNAETPSGEKNAPSKTYRNDDEHILDLIKEAGGAENIDWNA